MNTLFSITKEDLEATRIAAKEFNLSDLFDPAFCPLWQATKRQLGQMVDINDIFVGLNTMTVGDVTYCIKDMFTRKELEALENGEEFHTEIIGKDGVCVEDWADDNDDAI